LQPSLVNGAIDIDIPDLCENGLLYHSIRGVILRIFPKYKVAQFSSHRPEKGNQVQQKYPDDEEILAVAVTCLVYCVLNKSV